MAKPLRPKRGTTAKNDAFTGLASEITIDTDKHSIRVHDNVTAGGHEILPKAKNDELYAPKNGVVNSINGVTGSVTPEQTGCLPSTGGRMAGAILGEKTKLTEMILSSGTGWTDGDATLYLRNSGSNDAGTFAFATGRADAFVALIGYPDGRLSWNGLETERVVEAGAGYVRYHSGLQICYGKGSTNDIGGCNIGFPVPFADVPEVLPVMHGSMASGGNWCMLYEPINGIEGNVWAFLPNGGHAQVGFSWVAVGRWK